MTDQQTLRSNTAADSSQQPDDVWRKEIHARVAGYRSRRGRRVEGAFSMRFPFPPSELEESPATVENELSRAPLVGSAEAFELPTAPISMAVAEVSAPPAESPATTIALAPPPVQVAATQGPELEASAIALEPEPDPQPRPAAAPRPEIRRKVIAFPRQPSISPETLYRLADPVVPEQPRILDVPEELEAFPGSRLHDGLQLSLDPPRVTASPDHIELPLPAVKISQRVHAAFIDCALVAGAAGIFDVACYLMLPKLALTKPLTLAAAALPVLLWGMYQYIFMAYGGATAGMRTARIRLITFQGMSPTGRHRRSRVVGLYFSAASLAMGLLWALVDVDALCWHDRISRTYLINRD